MAGPWEKYGTVAAGPWQKYAPQQMPAGPTRQTEADFYDRVENMAPDEVSAAFEEKTPFGNWLRSTAGRRRTELQGGANPAAGRALNVLAGLPLVGEWMDSALAPGRALIHGTTADEERAKVRQARDQFAAARPGEATAAQLGGVGLSLPLLAPFAPAGFGAGGLGTQAVRGGILGGVLGGTEGAVSGAGAADDGDRWQGAVEGGLWGTALGAPVGVFAPAGARAWNAVADKAAGLPTGRLRDLAVILLSGVDDIDPARVRAAGPDAMPVDASPQLAANLDWAVNRAGPGSTQARRAIEDRAAGAQQRITGALDQHLGPYVPPKAAARGIADSTRAGRTDAYEAAYSAPIDYASEAGRNIEDVLSRVPPRMLRAAVDDANEEMISRGIRNQQIMAEIAEGGTVTFREMPNVRQLDQLKRALDRQVPTDDFGRVKPEGLRPQRLANELRTALSDAVPEYRAALSAGADKIAQDQGLRLGRNFFSTKVSREDVADAVSVATGDKLKAIRTGVRSYIDDIMARVKRTAGNPNTDPREALKAVTELSSRESRDKLAMVLPDAGKLLDEIDAAAQALELRAAVAVNSKTAPRAQMDQRVSALTEPGSTYAVEDLFNLHPGTAARKAAGTVFAGRSAADNLADKDAIFSAIARALTLPRGADAELFVNALQKVQAGLPASAARSGAINRAMMLGGASGHQSGMQIRGR